MKYDVFISYSSKDQKIVEGLSAYFEQRRIRCFVAYRDIPRGVVWADAIVEGMDESRMMVVVYTENFNVSQQVNREIEIASNDGKPILTFRLSDTPFKGAKKYYLTNLNWIDAFPDPNACFEKLVIDVSKILDIPYDLISLDASDANSEVDSVRKVMSDNKVSRSRRSLLVGRLRKSSGIVVIIFLIGILSLSLMEIDWDGKLHELKIYVLRHPIRFWMLIFISPVIVFSGFLFKKALKKRGE